MTTTTHRQHRRPLRDLPISLFTGSDSPLASATSPTKGKRPFSPSSLLVSPSKRRLLVVEGILSPKRTPGSTSPRKKTRLSEGQTSQSPARRNLLNDLVASPPPLSSCSSTISTQSLQVPATPSRSRPLNHTPNSLAPSPEIKITARSTRNTRANTEMENTLMAALMSAPLPENPIVGIPTIADPTEDHYPGFDVYKDPTPETSKQSTSNVQQFEDELDEDKENQKPRVEVATARMRPRASTPTFPTSPQKQRVANSISSPRVSHVGSSTPTASSRLAAARKQLEREVDMDAGSDDDDDLLDFI